PDIVLHSLYTITYFFLVCTHFLLLLSILFVFLYCSRALRALHSFPTRRSSDLTSTVSPSLMSLKRLAQLSRNDLSVRAKQQIITDRKSTRLNSSHVSISYAVFCLKKKNFQIIQQVICSELHLLLRQRSISELEQ